MPSQPINQPFGAGVQPAGLTGIGLGTPLGLPSPGNGFGYVADVVAVRMINPLTKDYVVDYTTNGAPHYAMTAMEQQVLVRLLQPVGKLSYATAFGDKTNNLTKQTATTQQVIGFVNAALADLIATKQIAVDAVSILANGGMLTREVRWRDLSITSPPGGLAIITKAPV